MKRVLKYLIGTMAAALIVLLLFVGSLFFREQRLPRCLLDRLERRSASDEMVCRIAGGTFGFRGGLRLQGVRIYDLSRPDSLENPVASARSLVFDWFRRTVDLLELDYRRLPDSYYEETPVRTRRRVEFDIPDLPELRLTLIRPAILGVNPDRVTARVNIGQQRIALSEIQVTMPDRDRKLEIAGTVELDLESQRLHAKAQGRVNHAQIAPVVDVLDAPFVQPYVAAFTEVSDAVSDMTTVDANLYTGDFDLRFDLKVPPCRYQGVPMSCAEGMLLVQTYNIGTNFNYRFTLDMPRAFDLEDRKLAGKLTVDNFAGPVRLGYDFTSALRFEDFLSIIDVFEPKTFGFLVCDTPPIITLKGTSGVSEADLDGNRLAGSVKLRRGALGGFQLHHFATDFTLKRDVLETVSQTAGKTGGQLAWRDRIYLEGFDREKAHFSVKATYKDGSLEELADVLSFDLGERNGKVDADLELCGFVGTNLYASLNGKGSVRVTDGHLAQMKLFAGLTSLLAERVPGVSFLVNQSQASADFVIKDGVFSSDNVYVEGGLISIKGSGTYDIAKDNLDFNVRAQLFKKESLVGKVVHPLTSPLTKLLLEFKVTGPMDNPTWRYVQILDRIF